ncbi:MAG TPA: hypothetical protein VNI77_04915 [Nitrososphaera sp.]|nr:hypothetical protein [Nitrososphaera sp.]
MHRTPVGTLKTCTIVGDVDQWYACITADDSTTTTTTTTPIISTSEYDTTKPVGIDVVVY